MKSILTTVFCLIAAFAAALSLPISTQAATVTYAVDPLLSSLTLSGNAFGLAYAAQVSGSLTDSWGGTIAADLTGGVLTFTGGSSITANLHPLGPFSTSPAPYPPGGDDYGVTASGVVPGFGSVIVNGVYRNLTLDIPAGTAQDLLAPAAMNLKFIGTSKLDYGILILPSTPSAGSSSLVGVNGNNTSAALVSLTPTTLTLPVQLHTIGSNRYEDWSGVIVATLVPEPSSIALGGVCAVAALLGLRRRK